MFYGWYVLAGIFAVRICFGGFIPYSLSLLVMPVASQFSTTVEQVMYSMTLTTCFGLVVSPLAGIMIDRYPVRWLMATGVLFFSGGLALLSRVGSIYQYIIVFAATIAISHGLIGASICSSTVSRWFTKSRGRALGLSAMGGSIGGMAVPTLVAYWISKSGWRGMLENMALLSLIAIFPIVILVVRGFPADIGLKPEKSNRPVQGEAIVGVQLSIKNILKMPGFWFIGISLGLFFAIYSSIIANLTPYVKSVGIDISNAPTAIMTVAIAGLAGTLIFGIAADKISLKLVLWLTICLMIICLLIMALEPSFLIVEMAMVFLGIAGGGVGPVWGSIMARVFGLLSYGRAMGLMSPLFSFIIMPTYSVVGRLFDIYGSYRVCLFYLSIAALVAVLILIPLRFKDDVDTKKGGLK